MPVSTAGVRAGAVQRDFERQQSMLHKQSLKAGEQAPASSEPEQTSPTTMKSRLKAFSKRSKKIKPETSTPKGERLWSLWSLWRIILHPIHMI